jgi:hypothetical protein
MITSALAYLIAYGAWQLGIVPLAWLTFLAVRRDAHRGAEWWWLAGAFFVSWIADACALTVGEPWLMSLVYPVSQAAIVGAVLLDREEAVLFVIALVIVGIMAVLWKGVGTPDVLLHTVAWLSVAIIALDHVALGRLRLALLAAFGFGWIAWIGFTLTPGIPTPYGYSNWLAYQGVRAIGIGTFCWAAMYPTPQLRMVRT